MKRLPWVPILCVLMAIALLLFFSRNNAEQQSELTCETRLEVCDANLATRNRELDECTEPTP